jgi:hypothetical protein
MTQLPRIERRRLVRRRTYAGGVLVDLLTDAEFVEALAEAAYIRERAEDAAREAEHQLDATADEALMLTWGSISDEARRPYRTTAELACREIAAIAAA